MSSCNRSDKSRTPSAAPCDCCAPATNCVVICRVPDAKPIAETLVDRFDAMAPTLYDPEDALRGSIETENRLGDVQSFPFVSISIGSATSENRDFTHYAEVVAIATEMKSVAKKTFGSSWARDRRNGT